MDKILELLNVSALNESDQEKIVERLEVLIESKAQEILEGKLQEAKEEMISEYEQKFETYTDKVLANFSDFVDTILEEELEIPDQIIEYARKGELYEDLIDEFKIRLRIDEGDSIDEEVKDLLKEARDEIDELRSQLDEQISTSMEAKELLKESYSQLYINELCEGLTTAQRSKIVPMLEGISDIETIDKKFGILYETFVSDEDEDDEDGKDSEPDNDEDDNYSEDEEKPKKKMKMKGKGKIEVDSDSDEETNESIKRNATLINEALTFLRENK